MVLQHLNITELTLQRVPSLDSSPTCDTVHQLHSFRRAARRGFYYFSGRTHLFELFTRVSFINSAQIRNRTTDLSSFSRGVIYGAVRRPLVGKVALHGVAGGRYVVWGVRLIEDTPNVVATVSAPRF